MKHCKHCGGINFDKRYDAWREVTISDSNRIDWEDESDDTVWDNSNAMICMRCSEEVRIDDLLTEEEYKLKLLLEGK